MRVFRAIIFILICIGLIWLAIILISRAFSGGDDNADTTTQTALVDLASTDSVAELYISGPIIVDQDHNAMRFKIDRNSSSIERIQGYQNTVVMQQSFPNNQTSYEQFLSALDGQGFTTGNNDPAAQNPNGACPFGNQYIYTITDGGKEIYHFWTTACGGGTYGGQRSNTKLLFTRQVPQTVLNDFSQSFSL